MVALLLLAPPFCIMAWGLYRALQVPENHIGFEPYLFMSAAVFPIVSALLSRGRLRYLALMLSALTVLVVASAVRFNVLLQYEDGIRLGMPEKPARLIAV